MRLFYLSCHRLSLTRIHHRRLFSIASGNHLLSDTRILPPKQQSVSSGRFLDSIMSRSFTSGTTVSTTTAVAPVEYLCVHVFCVTKPGTEDAFLQATLENARQSAQEPGIARFDVLQDSENKQKFCLVEVYKTPKAPAEHKETRHYLTWRDTVADMMAEPRQAIKFVNKFPSTVEGWSYGDEVALEADPAQR